MATCYTRQTVIFFTLILILWKSSGIYVNADKISDKEVGRKQYKEEIVYDVSQVIHNNENPNETEILPEDIYVRETNTSTKYYFIANGSLEGDMCSWTWKQARSWDYKCDVLGIKGLAIMFGDKAKRKDVLDVMSMPGANTILSLVNLWRKDNSSVDSVTILLPDKPSCTSMTGINEFLGEGLKISSVKQSIKVGVEYNDEYLEGCPEDEWVRPHESVNHTIFTIHLSPHSTMLSFAKFKKKVDRLIQMNRRFGNVGPRCTQFIRLHNDNWNTVISEDNYEMYNALMSTYLHTFSQQNTGNEVYIFSPTAKKLHILSNNEFFRQRVTLLHNINWNVNCEHFSPQKSHLVCENHQFVKLLLSNVQNVLLSEPQLEGFGSLLAPCHTSQENVPTHFSPPFNSFLSLGLQENKSLDEQVEKVVEMLANNPTGIKISRAFIDTNILRQADNLTNAVNLLQSQNIEACCWRNTYVRTYFEQIKKAENISAIIDSTMEQCGRLLNLTKKIDIIIPFQVVLNETNEANDLLTLLSRFHQAKCYFEGVYSGAKLIPRIGRISGKRHWDTKQSFSPYCEREVKRVKEYWQTVYSFANIHGWSIIVPVDYFDPMTIWSSVETDREQINTRQLNFPLLFRTNAPLTAGEDIPMTYPCIERTLDASQSQIKFLENPYSGATFQARLRETFSLSKSELQTTLKLAMIRFPSVEIIAESRQDFKLTEKVILSDPPGSRNMQNLNPPFVYIQVPLADAHDLQAQVYSLVSKNHTAVHVSNWESLSLEKRNLWKNVRSPPIQNFGVTVQNCSHEIKSKVGKLKNLPFMWLVRYVVCNVAPVSPSNLNTDWMTKYFGILFYTKSYMEHFLSAGRKPGKGVEVMFRLNYICLKANEMEQFLRFLNDVKQHSAAYKIRYFLVRAVEKESSANCSNGWWRPDSYADLTNISSFVNREDEYAERPARIPFQPEPAKNFYTVYIIGTIVPIFAIFIVALMALWLHQRKARFLTQREIHEFFHGEKQSGLSNPASCNLNFANMKFPKEYEIPLKDIRAEELIGSGQFGVVHRGILSNEVEVAIKIPRSNCGKEQFKSALSELKILCYIGKHRNIISFLGASTKAIANGNLYIVLEYCSNGCLLQFLHDNRESGQDSPSLTLYQLCGFSLEIASGMEYIAEKRVVHADLAARNVLLTAEGTCKIADFGLSRRLYEMNEYVKSTYGPLPWRWMALESLRDREFTTKSDVWSYGVTLWEIFSLGVLPYPGLNWTVSYVAQLENGMRMEKASQATDIIHAKTLDCWNGNSDARPTFAELREFFVALRNEQYAN